MVFLLDKVPQPYDMEAGQSLASLNDLCRASILVAGGARAAAPYVSRSGTPAQRL